MKFLTFLESSIIKLPALLAQAVNVSLRASGDSDTGTIVVVHHDHLNPRAVALVFSSFSSMFELRLPFHLIELATGLPTCVDVCLFKLLFSTGNCY